MDSTTKNIFWNLAGTAGLLMGLTSTAAMFLGQFFSSQQLSTVLTSILGLVLWILETGTCIYIMHFFMKMLAQKCPKSDNTATFKMGIATAFLSSLIYSAASFANIAFISADMFNEQVQMLLQQADPIMDSNTKGMMNKMIENMPQITFFSNLVYCFVFGTFVSAVISRYVPAKDPFAEYKQEKQ